MILQEFAFKNLYGYVSKKISFNPDINLLVGINGSGKTTALNMLNWILTPSIGKLCVIKFDYAELRFIDDNIHYLIRVEQTDEELTYSIYSNKGNLFEFVPIQIKLKYPTIMISDDVNLQEKLIKEYNEYIFNPEERKSLRKLRDLLKMTIVNLDRKILNNSIESNITIKRHYYSEYDREVSSPIELVKDILRREYSLYQSKESMMNKDLIHHIIMSSFTNDENHSTTNITPTQIEKLKNRVITLMNYNAQQDINKSKLIKIENNEKLDQKSKDKIITYFDTLQDAIKDSETNNEIDQTYFFIFQKDKFNRIVALANAFEKHDKSLQVYYSDIDTYLHIVNKFLIDSAKILMFNKETGEIVYRVVAANGTFVSMERNINELSSGERQIIILFAFIKFYNTKSSMILIDEPELSLHPKWQSYFLDAVKEIGSENNQLILATHSPDIVGNNEKYCKVLFPYN